MFFVIGLSSCFVLPCFGAGCHTFGLKIATATLRPRNDTKTGRFCLENRRFLFYAVVFCAVSLRISSFKRFVSEIAPFSRKTDQICHCEEGAILRPTRQSLTDRFAIPKRTIAKGSGSSPDPNIYYRTYKNRLLRNSAAACFLLTAGRSEAPRRTRSSRSAPTLSRSKCRPAQKSGSSLPDTEMPSLFFLSAEGACPPHFF